jgi:hypothetical protein
VGDNGTCILTGILSWFFRVREDAVVGFRWFEYWKRCGLLVVGVHVTSRLGPVVTTGKL